MPLIADIQTVWDVGGGPRSWVTESTRDWLTETPQTLAGNASWTDDNGILWTRTVVLEADTHEINNTDGLLFSHVTDPDAHVLQRVLLEDLIAEGGGDAYDTTIDPVMVEYDVLVTATTTGSAGLFGTGHLTPYNWMHSGFGSSSASNRVGAFHIGSHTTYGRSGSNFDVGTRVYAATLVHRGLSQTKYSLTDPGADAEWSDYTLPIGASALGLVGMQCRDGRTASQASEGYSAAKLRFVFGSFYTNVGAGQTFTAKSSYMRVKRYR